MGIDHSWIGDLEATLTSPSGTKIRLFNRAGGENNSGNNFCQTLLDDAGSKSIQAIAIAGCPGPERSLQKILWRHLTEKTRMAPGYCT